MRCNNILEAIGHTPLVRLSRITKGLPAEVYVKVDYMNPGGSVKDRIATFMIDEAERSGLLKPGGTIIEGTSGNTGMGLALVAAVRGYKMVFTITDKQSKEKIDLLKALGAEVIVCPTAVEPDDPRSYYSVAKKLAREIRSADAKALDESVTRLNTSCKGQPPVGVDKSLVAVHDAFHGLIEPRKPAAAR